MARTAVISDIHANAFALDATLDDIAGLDQPVDEILVGGDLVGRGPQGSAVVRRIRELGLRSVRGNHEDYLLSFRKREVPEAWLDAPEWACSRWMAAELSAADHDFIDDLPFTLVGDASPSLRLFHGSPRSYHEGLGEWTTTEVVQEHFDSLDETLLVVAHTHRARIWEVDGGVVANVGSVGLPFNGDVRAQYAVFTETSGRWDVELRQVDYDRDALLEHYRTSGFLAEGGATSVLLKREVETGRPHVVPFLKWCEAKDFVPLLEHVDAFLDFYDPNMSLMELIQLFAGGQIE